MLIGSEGTQGIILMTGHGRLQGNLDDDYWPPAYFAWFRSATFTIHDPLAGTSILFLELSIPKEIPSNRQYQDKGDDRHSDGRVNHLV
jgi:hypothetical protein